MRHRHPVTILRAAITVTGLSVLIASLSSGAGSIGRGVMCPTRLQIAGHGGTVSRRKANKKLTVHTDHHESAHQSD